MSEKLMSGKGEKGEETETFIICFSSCGIRKFLAFRPSLHLFLMLPQKQLVQHTLIQDEIPYSQIPFCLPLYPFFPWSPSHPGALAPMTTLQVCSSHSDNKKNQQSRKMQVRGHRTALVFPPPGNSVNLFVLY